MLMMSAIVNVSNNSNDFIPARILLDTYATANFITSAFVKKLNIKIQSCTVKIGAVNGLNTTALGVTDISIHSLNNNFSKQIQCIVIANISNTEPSKRFPRESIKIPNTIHLADSKFHLPRPVDILLGSGPTASLLQSGQIKLTSNMSDLFLQKTKLGWVVIGGYKTNINSKIIPCH